MLSIRFVRIGKKKYPIYRLAVMEKGKNPRSAYLEGLGTYNPHTKEKDIKKDRVQYWLSRGAKPTPTIFNLLIDLGFIKADKVRASKSQPGKKKQGQIARQKAEEAAAKKNQEIQAAAAPAEVPQVKPAEITSTEAIKTDE